MIEELMNLIEASGDPISVISALVGGLCERALASGEIAEMIKALASLYEGGAVAFAVVFLVFGFLLCRFPNALARPLGFLISGAAGFLLALCCLPPEAIDASPILVAVIAAIVCALLYRLVVTLLYFLSFGFFTFISAYTGYIFGIGKEDITLSLVLSAAAILTALLLLTPARTLGALLAGGALIALAVTSVLDLSVIFGEAATVAYAVIAALVSLFALLIKLGRGRKRSGREERQAD